LNKPVFAALHESGFGTSATLGHVRVESETRRITDIASQNVDLEDKRLELLRELLPYLSRLGMLANTANPLFDASLKHLRPAAEALGVTLDLFEGRNSDEIERRLTAIRSSTSGRSFGRT
jgi:ABC-type uncharacterized transport system substrate-binding protein